MKFEKSIDQFRHKREKQAQLKLSVSYAELKIIAKPQTGEHLVEIQKCCAYAFSTAIRDPYRSFIKTRRPAYNIQ